MEKQKFALTFLEIGLNIKEWLYILKKKGFRNQVSESQTLRNISSHLQEHFMRERIYRENINTVMIN